MGKLPSHIHEFVQHVVSEQRCGRGGYILPADIALPARCAEGTVAAASEALSARVACCVKACAGLRGVPFLGLLIMRRCTLADAVTAVGADAPGRENDRGGAHHRRELKKRGRREVGGEDLRFLWERTEKGFKPSVETREKTDATVLSWYWSLPTGATAAAALGEVGHRTSVPGACKLG
jgi:hypothetical protein